MAKLLIPSLNLVALGSVAHSHHVLLQVAVAVAHPSPLGRPVAD